MNPEQEIELVLRVLSTQPTHEEIFHLEDEDVNPRKVEQEPEKKPKEEPEERPEEEPEEKPEEEPAPLPVAVGGTLSLGRKCLCELLLLRGSPLTSAVGCTEFSLGTISWWEAPLPILIRKYAAFR
jgi:hypothetical protein